MKTSPSLDQEIKLLVHKLKAKRKQKSELVESIKSSFSFSFEINKFSDEKLFKMALYYFFELKPHFSQNISLRTNEKYSLVTNSIPYFKDTDTSYPVYVCHLKKFK